MLQMSTHLEQVVIKAALGYSGAFVLMLLDGLHIQKVKNIKSAELWCPLIFHGFGGMARSSLISRAACNPPFQLECLPAGSH